MSYKLTPGDTILRLADNAFIPAAPGNRDYREYLDWLEAGNTPEPAPAPPPPGPDYLAFWDALLVSNVYQTIRAQALTTPAVLVACTEFIAAFSDAKVGRPNVPAIQACINNLMQAGTFTPEELGELQDLLVYANLQDLFTLTL
jgi:hypothetical protein